MPRKGEKYFCLTSADQFGYRIIVKSLIGYETHYNNVTEFEWIYKGKGSVINSKFHGVTIIKDLRHLVESVTIKKAKKLAELFEEQMS